MFSLVSKKKKGDILPIRMCSNGRILGDCRRFGLIGLIGSSFGFCGRRTGLFTRLGLALLDDLSGILSVVLAIVNMYSFGRSVDSNILYPVEGKRWRREAWCIQTAEEACF